MKQLTKCLVHLQSDANPPEDKLPKKKPNTSVQQQKKSPPKPSTSKVPEIIRSPKKLPIPTMANQIPDRPTRELTQQKVFYSINILA